MTSKIYHVHLSTPHNGEQDFHFGSMSAIYDVLTSEQIGCSVGNLWNRRLRTKEPYQNDKCSIREVPLYRKDNKK